MIADTKGSKEILSRVEEWRGPIFGIVTEEIEAGGTRVARNFMDHPGAVAVIALDDDGRVALLNQYRHPVRARLWEIPAGLLDHDGEDYLEAAKRELAEEADLTAETWHVLVDWFASPGCTNESTRIFLARDLRPAATTFVREAEEAEMTLEFVDLDEAAGAIIAGRMHSPDAIVGILAALRARESNWADLRDPSEPWLRGL